MTERKVMQMSGRSKYLLRGEQGQSLVEFALILPLLILLVTGIMQFGSIYNDYIVLQNAAREGARAGVVGKSDAEISDIVYNYAAGLDSSRLTVTVAPVESVRRCGDTLTVSLEYSMPVTIGLLQPLLGNQISLDSQIKMRL
ncbi:MAG: TadE/TadG family type IV pilus assembly protein [bacterium]